MITDKGYFYCDTCGKRMGQLSLFHRKFRDSNLRKVEEARRSHPAQVCAACVREVDEFMLVMEATQWRTE